jgi:1-acyl-sn-glycerol-3-phosphate acyltransferase
LTQNQPPMQSIIIARPYQFVPPHRGTFWARLLRLWLPRQLRRSFGTVSVECHGVEHLRRSVQAGHGILLAPNHCRPCDPFVLDALGRQVHRYFHVLASWHLFMQSRLQRWLLPRAGVFSIYREGTDREALKCAIQILVEARRPLVLFPEGVISRHNDRLNHLMEGTALIARTAAKQRAAAQPPGKIVLHPVAIRWLFDGDVDASVAPLLDDIERRLTWRARPGVPVLDRMSKIGGALLALKEIEYGGAVQDGELIVRVQRLINRVLDPLEEEWLKGRREKDVIARIKLLRMAILPAMISGDLPKAEQDRRWRQLSDTYLAQQLACYPAGYLTSHPTPERIVETAERFEEDLTDRVRVFSPFRAVVEVGEALEVSPDRPRVEGGDPLMNTLRERLEAMLAASLAEYRPGATMP